MEIHFKFFQLLCLYNNQYRLLTKALHAFFLVSGDSVTFSLSGSKSSDFTIHASSGVVTLTDALNYEVTSSYSLTVTASDSNGGVTQTSLTVTVTDVNDVPVSLGNPYSATIAEDEPSGTRRLLRMKMVMAFYSACRGVPISRSLTQEWFGSRRELA